MLKDLELLEWKNFLLLDRVEVGILVIDGKEILFANSKFSRIVGLNLRELQAKPLGELAGEAWVDFSLGQSWADALPWPMQDGSERWFEVSQQSASFEGRAIQIATCIDVTAKMRAEGAEANMLQMITEIIESSPVGTFVIDEEGMITHWNRACEVITGASAMEQVGSNETWRAFYPEARPILSELVMRGESQEVLGKLYDSCWPSQISEDGWEAEVFFPRMGSEGLWLHVAATPLRDAAGKIVGAIETLIDVTSRRAAEEKLRHAREAAEELVTERTRELSEAKAALEQDVARRQIVEQQLQHHLREVTLLNTQLHEAQESLVQSQQQLLQNDKLASIGQLAAGVAHEINNPIGYVFSNISTLQGYLDDLLRLVDACSAAEPAIADAHTRDSLAALRKAIDLDYLKTDILDLMSESREGIERVRKIVQDLKDFSHVDASTDWQWADIERGIESTLNVVNNEIKYKADVVRDFEPLPQIQCMPSQLNQVFMNLLVNAAHAMREGGRGEISIRTRAEAEQIRIEIEDNGSGMPPEVLKRIFEPFYTTKPVGKGTGLGLSLSFGIIQKHHGKIEVSSTPGQGTTFTILLPLEQPAEEGQDPPPQQGDAA